MTVKHVAGLASIICLLAGVTLALKLDSNSAKQSTLSPTQGAAAAMANVEIAEPSIQAYLEASGSYTGMTLQALQAAGGGTALPPGFQIGWVQATRYCVEDSAAGGTAYLVGPAGTPAVGSCPAAA